MKYIFAFYIALALSACVTKSNPAQTQVSIPGVGNTTYHCPPGQAKKGKC